MLVAVSKMKPVSQMSAHNLPPVSFFPAAHLMHLPAPISKHTAQKASAHAVHFNSGGTAAVTSWNVFSIQSAEQIVFKAVVIESSLKDFSQRVQVLASEHSRQFDGQAVNSVAVLPVAVPKGTILTQIWPVRATLVSGFHWKRVEQAVQAKLDVQVSQPKTHLSQVLVTILSKNFVPQPAAATQVYIPSSAIFLRGVATAQVVH